MTNFQALIQGVKSDIAEADVAEVKSRLEGGVAPTLIDVREQDEHSQGSIKNATWIARGLLELRIEAAVPDKTTPIVVYCAGGVRSALAARSLRELGYAHVTSMSGGFAAWKAAGYAWVTPTGLTALTGEQARRYARHTRLPEIGVDGQIGLLASKVLCVGAGGLGSPSAMYLAAAGIGTLGLVDDDVVDESNLQRQIMHSQGRVGMAKVTSAEVTLRGLNPDLKVLPFRTRLARDNALEIMAAFDVIVDGSDNFQTRYLINDAALRLGKPVVHASIYRFEGQLSVFSAQGAPCYRCLFPQPPPRDAAPSCAEAGVLGVLPGVMGVLQATEVIKLILGLGHTLAGRLLVYDALQTSFRELRLAANPACPTCAPGVDRRNIELIDYAQFCAGG
ncbi:MAG: molybdopterin-synthase adenylyltransferase MoeB [Myxococcales bacterium]|nr:molybdopterin-synthase adenylyltransferase MoeB [Myxococcales bacterium]